jgi:hypothetical protein
MPDWLATLNENAEVMLASVMLIVVLFLIGRVGRASQPVALALALAPVALLLALNKAILPAMM